MRDLGDLTAQCIRCGFCLESCPTFKLTSNELLSPRGRIYLVRSALEGTGDWEQAVETMDSCLGCRACETVCPSGVEYGAISELARERLSESHPRPLRRAMIGGLSDHRIARVQIALGRLMPGGRVPGLLSRLLSGQKPEAETPKPAASDPWPPIEDVDLPPVRGEVVLLEGCVMRVLYEPVHEATRRLLRRVGYRVVESGAGCCGSLHLHSGYLVEARQLALRLDQDLPKDLPVIVNSAGCGSTMKEYAHLDGALESLGRRSIDASRFLLENGLQDALRRSRGIDAEVTYHDACHLAHGQGIRDEPRALIQAIPRLRYRPLQESDTCCGSAGIYNVVQPQMARQLVERKWAFVEKTGASIVATGNPGCLAWLEQVSRERGESIRVLHTLELLEASFSGFR